MTISLLIDTCTEYGVVAFFSGNTLLYEGVTPKGFNNSTYMMLEVDRGLEKLGQKIKDLQFIAVTIGPGSYTGMRIGVMAAKTLAYAGNIPLVTLCALDGYIPDGQGDFMALIDAKIGGTYFRIGRRNEESIDWLTEPAVSALEKLDALQHIHRLVTPNKQLLQKKVSLLYPTTAFEWIEKPPSVAQFMAIANAKFQAGIVERSATFDLLYLRKTEAEIQREQDCSH